MQQNLIENSITYKNMVELERPYLSIEAVQLETHIMVRIKDNGVGIEKEYLERFDLHFPGMAYRVVTARPVPLSKALTR